MSTTRRSCRRAVGALTVAVAMGAVGAGHATGAPGPVVSGTLVGARGATVLALAPDGAAVRAPVGSTGAFRLRAPARTGVTLHVVSRSGDYVGPVVLRRGRRAAWMGLASGGRLGRVLMRGRYAALATPQAPGGTTGVSVITDSRGRPLGAGRHGLVAVPSGGRTGGIAQDNGDRGGRGPGDARPGRDGDRDGIPNVLDTDANGNGVLDNFDPAASVGPGTAGVFSSLHLGLGATVNANAGTASRDAIDARMRGDNAFAITLFFDGGAFDGRRVTSANVDCGLLVYCRVPDGTAVIGGLSESGPDLPRGERWVTYSPDGSGRPNLERIVGHDGRPSWAMGVSPRAGLDDIAPGDLFDIVFRTATGDVRRPSILSAYFVTTPAVTSWSAGGAATTVTYPTSPGTPGASESNPIVMTGGALTLTLWRPQRQGIVGAETAAFMDIGRLHYGITVDTAGRQIGCAGHYSALSSSLDPGRGADAARDMARQLWPLTDAASDAPPDPTRTIGFTVDLTACLSSQGEATAGRTVPVAVTAAGEDRPGGNDRAVQTLYVRLPG